jgi:hypothetical protein
MHGLQDSLVRSFSKMTSFFIEILSRPTISQREKSCAVPILPKIIDDDPQRIRNILISFDIHDVADNQSREVYILRAFLISQYLKIITDDPSQLILIHFRHIRIGILKDAG